MQHSPCEIKDKLLRALDQEYNVVDMATVLEVISLLEKAIITRETLEKTRIGKYINELRKRTSNEQLARRAKELVKSWRKLLPQTENSVNGERISNIGTSVLGPGPGPGFGPGPGPGNKIPKPYGSAPVSPHFKTSPSISCERSTSPFCSSASNSPQFATAKLQGSSKPPTPFNYAPNKLSHTGIRNDRNNSQNTSSVVCSQIFKPVSPALAAIRQSSNIGPVSTAEFIPQPKPRNRCISPAHFNSSRSCSPRIEASAMNISNNCESSQQNYEKLSSPSLSACPISSGSTHSTVEIAKTNVANKRLRKDANTIISRSKKIKSAINDFLCDYPTVQNGVDAILDSPDRLLPSESSAFKSLSSLKCENEKKENLRLEKQKSSDGQVSDVLRDKFSSLSPGAKLPKVKTTQQLIEELQARKDALSHPFTKLRDVDVETDCFSWKKSPNNSVPSAELLRSKSELMKKFLSSSPESPSNSANNVHVIPSAERMSSPPSDNVPSKFSVITQDKDFGVPYTDPVSAEIEQILSTLPPINPEDINLDDSYEPLPVRTFSIADVERDYSQHWNYVNGTYSSDGSWHPWHECTEQEISAGETMIILPYVNID